MFGLSPKPPLSEDARLWVVHAFARLDKLLGRQRLLQAHVFLPNDRDFPDPFDQSPEAAERLFLRVCGYMHLDPSEIDFEVFSDDDGTRALHPLMNGIRHKSPAGLYFHGDSHRNNEDSSATSRACIAIGSRQLKNPLALIATIAHELSHVILMRDLLLAPETPDNEPLTDLLTVYLGFGVFTANAAFQFNQFQDALLQGWSTNTLGYLSQELFGYALACFATLRGEANPPWERDLTTNVRVYFKRSLAWLRKHPFEAPRP